VAQSYDQIGASYNSTRIADQRIVTRLVELIELPTGSRLVDIGAGTGNYSQALVEAGFNVSAVEPSAVMRDQGKESYSLSWHEGRAEDLPLLSGDFDAAEMTLCIHHTSDWCRALQEAMRVTDQGPLVIFMFDIEFKHDFWLYEYFPELVVIDATLKPDLHDLKTFVYCELERSFYLESFLLPHYLSDHFLCADWARPQNYLRADIQAGISSFHKLDEYARSEGLERLARDINDGRCSSKYGKLLKQESIDYGYRFVRIG
jgi:ubiquinone/menaquinone biosynthesis C-methylase UbiE